MAIQLFQGGPIATIPIAPGTLPAQITPGSILPMWVAASYTPYPAGGADRAGKVYGIKAGGLLTNSVATITYVLTPLFGANNMGASVAQLMPVQTAVPWSLEAELLWPKVLPGANSQVTMYGKMSVGGTGALAGPGTIITFGGVITFTAIDASVGVGVGVSITAGGTVGVPTLITHYAYIFDRN